MGSKIDEQEHKLMVLLIVLYAVTLIMYIVTDFV